MKAWFYRFMQGRYGVDGFGKFLTGVSLAALVLNMVVSIFWPRSLLTTALWMLAIFCLIYSYFRMFSRNKTARYQEYNWFLGRKSKFDSWVSQLRQCRHYRFFRCPQCKQKIRVPRGKGRLRITCPKCHTVFEKKS